MKSGSPKASGTPTPKPSPAAEPPQASPAPAAEAPQASPPPQASPGTPKAASLPPPPAVERRPARAPRNPAPAQTAAPAPQPDPGRREIPKDPAQREEALKSVRDEATLILGLLAGITSRITPDLPLTEAEVSTIQPPLEMVLYKYGGSLPCEWQLVIAVGMSAIPRYLTVKQAQKQKAKQDETIADAERKARAA